MLQNLVLLMSYVDLKSRILIFLLVVMTFLSAFAELVSIGAIIPFLTVLSDPSILISNLYILKFISLAEFSDREIILFTGLFFCSAVVITTIFRMALFFLQLLVSRQIGRCFSNRIFHNILRQPLEFHQQTNSANLNALVIKEVDRVIVKYVNPSIIFASSGLILTVIVVALTFVSLEVSLILIGGISCFYVLMNVLSKSALSASSSMIHTQQSKVIRVLNESLGLIRDILIRGDQIRSEYLSRFEYSDWEVRKAGAYVELIGMAPRFLIEAIGVLLIVSVAMHHVLQLDKDLGSILPILGAFALGAQRLLPLAQTMYAHFVSMKGHVDDVRSVLHHMSLRPEFLNDKCSQQKIFCSKIDSVELVNVSFSYSRQESVLSNVNVKMPINCCVGVTGLSGAGKSTFADIVMGLVKPQHGELLVNNLPVWDHNVEEWRSNISHVPQKDFFLDASVRENIIGSDRDIEFDELKFENACNVSGVSQMLSNRPLGLEAHMGENATFFSGGQRQRIGLARAIYQQKPVLVLDEAMSALDYESERKIISGLKNLPYGPLVIIISHRQELLSHCDYILEVTGGTARVRLSDG